MRLGIDPGTHCGWAVFGPTDIHHASGVWNLSPRRHEGGGMRFLRLRTYLEEVIRATGVTTVYYEEVHRHKGTDAAHIYGGIIAHIQQFCEQEGIAYAGVPVAAIKKAATGKGNANKDLMLAAAIQQFYGVDVIDDNHADALFIALHGPTLSL